MNELGQLQTLLARTFRDALPAPATLQNMDAVRALQKITRDFDGIAPPPTDDSIMRAVMEYRSNRRAETFRTLKYVCYGAAAKTEEDWFLCGDNALRTQLLEEVVHLSTSRQLKCFQALLNSYFSFPRFDDATPETAQGGWEKLRDWLSQTRRRLQIECEKNGQRLPGWFGVLIRHASLLTEHPCDNYSAGLLRGDNSLLEEARRELGIPHDSWVMEEAVLALVKAACAQKDDDAFRQWLDDLLKLALNETELKISELLQRSAIALLVSRYARRKDRPEHPALRDAAVSIIGNPWLKKGQWDAWVKKVDGQPNEVAREMVNGWLKRRLITDFFDLLSTDGRADSRRLKYWLRFEPVIDDLWFALGEDAFEKSKYDPRYQEVEKRTDKKHWLRLTNESDTANNAFIMRIGNSLVVEFGLRNNACFIYSVAPAPFSLDVEAVTESRLKIHNRNGMGVKHSHSGNWEEKFDSAICPKIGYRPGKDSRVGNMSKPSHQAELPEKGKAAPAVSPRLPAFNEKRFWIFVKQYSLPTKDKRSKGGALWVNIEQSRYPVVDQWLESQGFKYRLGVGWYRE